jgi:ribosomal protein S10
MTYIREIQSTNITSKGRTQTGDTGDTEEDKVSTPSFFVHPSKQNRLTFLKAPMAHKTFSQEQFMNKSYNLTISFNNVFREQSTINSVNNSLYTALYLRTAYLPAETNLLFLKKLRISITCKDERFMRL